ncbi:MAG TPA: nuclear transport factor 2 family protein [Trebonia sp.]
MTEQAPGGDADWQLAAQALVVELFARIDARDIDGAVALYAPDAVFPGAKGRPEIRETMLRGLLPNAGQRSRHLLGNLRSAPLGADSVLVRYTAVAYTMDGTVPLAARSVIDQEQVVRRRGGVLEVAEQRIPGFAAP